MEKLAFSFFFCNFGESGEFLFVCQSVKYKVIFFQTNFENGELLLTSHRIIWTGGSAQVRRNLN